MAANVVQDRLGDLFVREGLITQDQLQEALREAQLSKTRIGFALVKLGFVPENQLTRALAKQFRVPAVDLEKVKVEDKILRLKGDLESAHDEYRYAGRTYTAEQVRTDLTQVVGIGRWTADIYLLVALGRPDIWPRGDLALHKAMQDLKGLEQAPSAEELEALGETWRPWRSVAARMLWNHYLHPPAAR